MGVNNNKPAIPPPMWIFAMSVLILCISACTASTKRLSLSTSTSITLETKPGTTFIPINTPTPMFSTLPITQLTPSPTHSKTPAAISTSTITPKPPTQSPTPFLSPTIPPDGMLKIQNLTILDQFPTDINITGTVIIHGYTDRPSFYLNFETGAKTTPVGDIYLSAVSPNRKFIAYIDATGSREEWSLVITTSGSTNIISWETDWLSIGYWLDNKRLLILRNRDPLLPSTIVLNPFSGERKEILPDYPDIETNYYSAEWWLPVYDPTLTRVVYPRVAGEERIVLWDLQKQRSITYLSSRNNPYGLTPVWSSNGQFFVMALEDPVNDN